MNKVDEWIALGKYFGLELTREKASEILEQVEFSIAKYHADNPDEEDPS